LVYDTVLNKLEYDLYTHPSESCDWINVLIAVFIESYRRDTAFKQNIVNKINNFFSDTQSKYQFIVNILNIYYLIIISITIYIFIVFFLYMYVLCIFFTIHQ